MNRDDFKFQSHIVFFVVLTRIIGDCLNEESG